MTRNVLVTVLTSTISLVAQSQSSLEIISKHIHPVSESDVKFSGPAMDWIESRAESCRFVVFGEQHNVQEIPLFVADVQDRLWDDGFQYLAVEMGPVAADTLSMLPFEEALAKNAFAIAFDNDADLELIRRCVERFDGPGDAVWGLDQSFSSLHLLEELIAIAPNDEAADFAKACIGRALDQRRDYIRRENFDDVAKLRELFSSPEAKRYIDALETSMRIYTNWRKAQDGAPTIYANLSEREGYMKDRFIEEMRAAEASGAKDPRVIVKLGGAHVMPGIGMNRVITFGTFAKEYARGIGSDALIIGIWTYNEDPVEAPFDSFFGDGDGFLIDLESLRPYGPPGMIRELPEGLAEHLYAYDAIVLLKNTERAGMQTMREYRTDKMRALRDYR